ncbi:putative deoxyribonuclease TATDN2 [Ruditapes philippinarum]|uniref:putative deoxyribonuclease TATDN2 n=1 Tax=Ruditapes philippinarum TaxID=129788 RepID=UPI00295B10D5|nr:putative deoxyribonuclease TATDN2 [Ruditapes philippinarum]
MVNCDPETYPVKLPSLKGFGAAIGVHPKKCQHLAPAKFQMVLDYLKSWDVFAVGETGLERTEPEKLLKLQEETLVKLLNFSMPVRPVFLHMREGADQHVGEVSAKCLQLMKANAAPTQKIHLHFGGTVEQVVGWLDAYPNCYFGFSAWVTSFDKYQIAALQRVPANRLLLETDAPYFKQAAARASTLHFLEILGR